MDKFCYVLIIISFVCGFYTFTVSAQPTERSLQSPKQVIPDLTTAKVTIDCVDCEMPFDMKTHKKLLEGLVNNTYLAQLRTALYVQDLAHQFQSKAHFDNCDFVSSVKYIDELLDDVGRHVTVAESAKSDGDDDLLRSKVEDAFYSLGQALHGVQDFYAHTNYLEMQVAGVKKITDIPIISPWGDLGFKRIAELQKKGMVSGFVFWGFPQKCPSGAASHSELAKDSDSTKSGKKTIPHLNNITQYKAASILAREGSLSLMRYAFRRWPLLKEVNGKHVAFEILVDMRETAGSPNFNSNDLK